MATDMMVWNLTRDGVTERMAVSADDAWDEPGTESALEPDPTRKPEIIWPNPEFYDLVLREVGRTYDGPFVQATDLTVINVTDEQIVVREAVVSELALPTGTTQGYLDAYRTPTDATSKISDFVSNGRWKEFKPRPLPEK